MWDRNSLVPSFSMLHAIQRATLKSWEWPGDEARIELRPELINQIAVLNFVTT